jgi:hypothetical protein
MTHKNYLGIVAAVSALVLGLASAGFAADQSAVKIKDSGSATVGCLVGDTGPTGTVTISPTTMWPPNHKLRPIDLSLSLDTPPVAPENVSLTVNSVVSDQQATDDVGHHGCGQKTAKQGSDVPTNLPMTVTGPLSLTTDALTTSFLLRAERCAKIGTRTYTVSVTCCNTDSTFCDAVPETLTVTVPKKKP